MTGLTRTYLRASRGATALLSVLCLATSAPAQTFGEAVRFNLSLGVQLCTQRVAGIENRVSSFRAAGFTERVEHTNVNSDTTHYFAAPAETVQVELYYGQMPEECSVSTNHLGVTGASEVLDAAMPRLYPGYVRKVTQGLVNPTTGLSAICVRYEDPTNPIGDVIGVWPGGNSQTCIDNGTSQIFSSSRV